MTVGILSTGIYLPENVVSGFEIAEKAGLPQEVVENKMGIRKKTIPGPDDHTCAMGIHAAREAIDKAGVNPKDIDVVIYVGEEYKEYPLWTAAIKLQEEIGAYRAWAFDASLRCGTTIMAMKLAKSLIETDPEIKTVLLAGGYRNSDFINYKNESTRFMFNLAAGGGALILQEGLKKNLLLETSLVTDGSFSEDVIVPVGGTVEPLTALSLNEGRYYLDVPDPEGMKKRLEQKSMDHFLKVIRESLYKSGYEERDIDYLAILHMKRSAHQYVLTQLGLEEEKSIYLEDYGHIGQFDQILSLELAEKAGKLKEGDVVVFVSAGIGYAWGASTIIWGEPKTGG
ncbi:3-oxoacyl-ACP synthase [Rossellomorea aquimaris]|uniref:3-oxoacyl-ACP synthase n=1 Tax=Rossellomorea aquimaris TaxID=189382 RepID=UPI001CD51273|nr:3-oxoacyl-ACP synthase [Rossellomorea aquimaris]MCA1056426.1 3-oxoacyl-ACP synthase [Rossellomorea aquimaris]